MMNILIILVAFLVVATLVQLLRVGELLSEVKNQDVNKVTEKDNKNQSMIMTIVGILFLASCVWQYFSWGHLMLPGATSEHGVTIDNLMAFTMILIIVVFILLHIVLFYFIYKYRKAADNDVAYYYPHNNKLELIWTIAPTIVLTVVILYGLSVWDQITNADTSKSEVIEVYGKQFDWKARYPGEDKTLGSYNYKLAQGLNALGVDMDDETSLDDKVTRELHLIVDKPVLLKFRSQDIIHSAFLPHFRVQMNCVPGMSTQFAFTPTKTTSEMKDQEGEDFEYVLLCNKICGVAHYNMQMKVVVETQEEYDAWLAEQNTLSEKLLTQK
jgi:cytochrome c oxidase subunit II